MLAFEGLFVELTAPDPVKLATFYEGVFGLSRVETISSGCTSSGAGLTLRIKTSFGMDAPAAGVSFGFRVPSGTDLDRAQEELVAAGAIVLSESKRGAVETLSCQDPAGNEFLVIGPSVDSLPQNLGLAPIVLADASPVNSPSNATTNSNAAPRPVGGGISGARPSRRDIDRLIDVERLAVMQETIAGLDMPFSSDDPATALSDMRAKLGVADSTDARVAEADAIMRAREREASVEEMLARYRAQTTPVVEDAAVEPAKEPSFEASKEPSLGPSKAEAEPPADPPSARTLGRSTKVDDSDD